jgi:hypothetical protein
MGKTVNGCRAIRPEVMGFCLGLACWFLDWTAISGHFAYLLWVPWPFS